MKGEKRGEDEREKRALSLYKELSVKKAASRERPRGRGRERKGAA